jgi:6-phosphogluconolactonase
MRVHHLLKLKVSRLLLVVLLCTIVAQAAQPAFQVFVGTYTDKQSKGIYTFRFDSKTGKMSAPELAAETDNPSFLAVGGRGKFLYAVNETENRGGKGEGGVTAFSVDHTRLKKLQEVPSLGADPAYLTLDYTGHYLLVANYTGGNVAVFPIAKDGKLGEHTAFDQHKGSSVNKERQAGPHAHSIQMSPDNRFALSADLGLDEVLAYRFDAKKGTLTAAGPAFAKISAGSGPRHVAFAPNGHFVYVTNEMAMTVTTLAYNPQTGEMREVQTVSTLPEDAKSKDPKIEDSTAEIAVDDRGQYLYVSNRGADTIAEFSIDQKNGKLTYVQSTPTGGKTPRFFSLDPTGKWMFVANQNSNDIFLFRVDPANGKLTATGERLEIGAPVCLVFTGTK